MLDYKALENHDEYPDTLSTDQYNEETQKALAEGIKESRSSNAHQYKSIREAFQAIEDESEEE